MQNHFTNSTSPCSSHYQWPPLFFSLYSYPHSDPSFFHFPSLFSSFTTQHPSLCHSLRHLHFQPYSQPVIFLLQHYHSSPHTSHFPKYLFFIFPQNAPKFGPTRFPYFPFCSQSLCFTEFSVPRQDPSFSSLEIWVFS